MKPLESRILKPVAAACRWAMLAVCLAGVPACRQPSKEETKKKKKLEVAESARGEREAVLRYAREMRAVLEWKAGQPPPRSEAEQRRVLNELALKLKAVPVKRLPADVADPWQEMLDAYLALAKSPSLELSVREQGAKAAAKLKGALRARGIVDLNL